MIDSPYSFRKATKNTFNISTYYFPRTIYTFRDSLNNKYIFEAHQIEISSTLNRIYAVKFYKFSHRFSDNKYNLLSNVNLPFKILTTCIYIMLDIYKNDDPFASFYFQGANLIGERRSNTKRLGVYEKICSRAFSPISFEHKVNYDRSTYLIINRHIENEVRDKLIRYVEELEGDLLGQ